MLDYVKPALAGTAEKMTSLNLPQKSSETKSLTSLLQPICHLPGRFGKDRLCGLGDMQSKIIFNKRSK